MALTRAAAEVATPILIAVLVILAVFIPLLSMGGIAGKLYAPLAVAVASAMTISLVRTFTLVPALVARVLPLHQVITVDAYIPGCPPEPERIWAAVSALLAGQPVMLEPKLRTFGA